MALKSTTDRYGSVAITIHWLSAILILILLASGFRAAGTLDPGVKAALLSVHVSAAVVLLCLTVLRIAWWWGFDRKPRPVAGVPSCQKRAARAVHGLFYVVILGMIASGIGMLALSGAVGAIFAGRGVELPDFWQYPPRLPHGVGARLLIGLLVLHTAAALYHHFGRRDGLLRRMWFGRQQRA